MLGASSNDEPTSSADPGRGGNGDARAGVGNDETSNGNVAAAFVFQVPAESVVVEKRDQAKPL